MPSSAMWWSPRRQRPGRPRSSRPSTGRSTNPLLLDELEDGLLEGGSPRTPPPAPDPAPAAPHPPTAPLSFHVRALAGAFRVTNAALTLASLATLGAALVLNRETVGALVPLALAVVAAGSAALGCYGTSTSPTRPASIAAYSSGAGAEVLTEAVLVVAGLVARGHAAPAPGPGPAPPPPPTPAPGPPAPRLSPEAHAALLAAGVMAALQVTGSAIASLLLPAASAAEDWQAEAAAAAEGWASPPRWGATTTGRASTLSTPPPAADRDGAAFQARMRDRYGLDTAALAYDPAARSAAWRRESEGRGGVGGGRGGWGRSGPAATAPPPQPLSRGGGGGGRNGADQPAETEGGRACVVM